MNPTKVGRPSLMATRRVEIVGSFIALVARKGLEDVTLDDIAADAGLQRSSVRHFVGNRRELITAAIVELSDRYVRSVQERISGADGADELITVLFSPAWLAAMKDNDRAFDSLIQEATRDPLLVEHVRRSSDELMAEIQKVLRRDHPNCSVAKVRETAYALVCLVEHNKSMQRLGYPSSLSKGAARVAHQLVRDISA